MKLIHYILYNYLFNGYLFVKHINWSVILIDYIIYNKICREIYIR